MDEIFKIIGRKGFLDQKDMEGMVERGFLSEEDAEELSERGVLTILDVEKSLKLMMLFNVVFNLFIFIKIVQ